MFVATNIILSLQNKRTFVATNIIFVATKQAYYCRDKHVFVATKIILVAAPTDDSNPLTPNREPPQSSGAV